MEWHNMTPDYFCTEVAPSGPFVWVSDGTEPYCRLLQPGETLEQACAEFGRGYDFGGDAASIDCQAELISPEGDLLRRRRFNIAPKS